MKKINENIKLINLIFDTVYLISNKSELFFGSAAMLIEKLQIARNNVAELDVAGIGKEVWQATSRSNREQKVLDMVNTSYDKIITWKPEARIVTDMNISTEKDLNVFFQKQHDIDRAYQPNDRTQIFKLYRSIGHYIVKINNDLDKEMMQLRALIDLEMETYKDEMESYLMKSGNIKLNPGKINEFSTLLNEMISKDFFLPVNTAIQLSKEDIMAAMGEMLHTELKNIAATPAPHPLQQTLTNTGIKTFPDYLLHPDKIKLAEKIRNEFSQEKGKNLRLLLKVLEIQNPPLITIGYRQAKIIYTAMQNYFKQNIGSYQSIFNYKIDPVTDAQDLENISIRFKHIISTL